MERGSQLSLNYPDPELADAVVRLRRWRLGDLACVAQAATDDAITRGTSLPGAYTPDAGRAYIERQWSRLEAGQGLSQVIADVRTDEALGQLYIAIRPQAWVAGLGYWVVPAARRRGLATRAARLAATWVLQSTGAARIEAWAATENLASQRVLAGAGFTREGVLRAFVGDAVDRHDMVVFSRLRSDLPA